MTDMQTKAMHAETPSRFGNPQDRPCRWDRPARFWEAGFGIAACVLIWSPLLAAAAGWAR